MRSLLVTLCVATTAAETACASGNCLDSEYSAMIQLQSRASNPASVDDILDALAADPSAAARRFVEASPETQVATLHSAQKRHLVHVRQLGELPDKLRAQVLAAAARALPETAQFLLETNSLDEAVSRKAEEESEVKAEVKAEEKALEKTVSDKDADKDAHTPTAGDIPEDLLHAGTGVANKGGEKLLEDQTGKGVQACYDAVIADTECAHDYLSYFARGDGSCWCNKARGFKKKSEAKSDIYKIPEATYEKIGDGKCLDSNGQYTDYYTKDNVAPVSCKIQCMNDNLCIAYHTQHGKSDLTCAIFAPGSEDAPEGWTKTSGNGAQEILKGDGSKADKYVCYKKQHKKQASAEATTAEQ